MNNGDYGVIPEEINPFLMATQDEARKDEFINDMFEMLYAKEYANVDTPLTIEGIPIAYRKKAFKEEMLSFVEKHSECGPPCSHLLRFYERKGFFKSIKYINRSKVVKMPKVAIGEDLETKKELNRRKKTENVRQWVVQYMNFPSKVSVLKL